jgi:hypothetical protein
MRRPKPWIRKQTGTWYVQINGVKHNLGSDKTAAFDQYDQLMSRRAEIGIDPPAVELLDRFLAWVKDNLKPESLDWYQRFVVSFGTFIGKRMRTRQLKAHHVTSWLTENGWKGSTANCAVRAVTRDPFNPRWCLLLWAGVDNLCPSVGDGGLFGLERPRHASKWMLCAPTKQV